MAPGTPHTLYVAHYGFPQLKGARHWSFLYYSLDRLPTALQLTGSTQTYAVKEPKKVLPDESVSYMGKVVVGIIHAAEYDTVLELLKSVPIVHGNIYWNCQDWIVDSLALLKQNGYDVQAPAGKVELAARLAEIDVSS